MSQEEPFGVNNPAKWEIDRYHPTNLQTRGAPGGNLTSR